MSDGEGGKKKIKKEKVKKEENGKDVEMNGDDEEEESSSKKRNRSSGKVRAPSSARGQLLTLRSQSQRRRRRRQTNNGAGHKHLGRTWPVHSFTMSLAHRELGRRLPDHGEGSYPSSRKSGCLSATTGSPHALTKSATDGALCSCPHGQRQASCSRRRRERQGRRSRGACRRE